MSFAQVMSASSISVKNTLSAKEIYAREIHINDPEKNKQINIFDYIQGKLNSIKNLESQLRESIKDVQEKLKDIPEEMNKISPIPPKIIKGEKGDKGDTGPPGNMGKPGPRGLRGAKGDSYTKLKELLDVNLEDDIEEGSILMFSDGKWVAGTLE